MSKQTVIILVIAVLSVMTIWGMVALASIVGGHGESIARLGDSFGVVTAFFAAAAFIAVLWALHLQLEEMKYLRTIQSEMYEHDQRQQRPILTASAQFVDARDRIRADEPVFSTLWFSECIGHADFPQIVVDRLAARARAVEITICVGTNPAYEPRFYVRGKALVAHKSSSHKQVDPGEELLATLLVPRDNYTKVTFTCRYVTKTGETRFKEFPVHIHTKRDLDEHRTVPSRVILEFGSDISAEEFKSLESAYCSGTESQLDEKAIFEWIDP